MGKNHRRQKKLKSEKSKTQMKSTIKSKTQFLPKGQNVTNTSFKVKSILIAEQLKEKGSPTSIKKSHTIPELIAKLKHSRNAFKIEACEELAERFKNGDPSVQKDFFDTVHYTSNLIHDSDVAVRKACFKAIKEILKTTSPADLAPYSNYIVINLSVATTNIDRYIQEDSLSIYDALIEHHPAVILKYHRKLFPELLLMISKLRSRNGVSKTLSLNLDGTVPPSRWRIQVLSRLYHTLDIISKKDQVVQRRPPIIDMSRNTGFILLKESGLELPGHKLHLDSDEEPNEYEEEQNEVLIKMHVGTLVPLLYETWLEVVPEGGFKKSLDDFTILNEEAATILKCIVHTLYLLEGYLKSNNLVDILQGPDWNKFLGNLLENFPYVYETQGRKPRKPVVKDVPKKFLSREDPDCVGENSTLLNLYLNLRKRTGDTGKRRKNQTSTGATALSAASLVSYVNKCLSGTVRMHASKFSHLVPILKEILVDNFETWSKRGVRPLEILDNLIDFQETKQLCSMEILNILTNRNNFQWSSRSLVFFESEKYQEWTVKLPRLLCAEEVSSDVVDTIFDLIRFNNKWMLDRFRPVLCDILDNLPRLKVIRSPTIDESKLELAAIMDRNRKECMWKLRVLDTLYYVTEVTQEHFDKIKWFISTYPDLPVTKHLLEVLDLRRMDQKWGHTPKELF